MKLYSYEIGVFTLTGGRLQGDDPGADDGDRARRCHGFCLVSFLTPNPKYETLNPLKLSPQI